MHPKAALKILIAGLTVLAAHQTAWAATLPVSVAVDGRPLDSAPKMLNYAKGAYPEELARRNKYFSGTAIVEFVVTADGKMKSPRIVQNSHWAFVPPAIKQLHDSTYSPGLIGGSPVDSRLTLTFSFDGRVFGDVNSGVWPYKVSPKSPAEYPPELRYDQAPMVMVVCDPVYPVELLQAGTKGKARVRYLLDPTGRVSAVEVVSATNPEFGAALVAAVETWKFMPALLKGKTTTTLLTHDYEFSPKTFLSDAPEDRVLGLWKNKPAEIVEVSALDEAPHLIYEVAPQYPRALEPKRITGQAEIEFVIDRTGRVRLPRIVSATAPEFGWAAATAIQQRIYESPKKQREAIDTRLRIILPFAP